jgi:hypothetical protein
MALDPETYVTVYLSLAHAMYEQNITIVTAAEIAHFSAQPDVNAVKHDILDELKAELYDWIPSDLNALQECLIMNITGPDQDGQQRCAQLASLATSPGWRGSAVHAARVNIDEAMDVVTRRYIPEGVDVSTMYRASGNIDFDTAADKFRDAVETEITKFREELDFLYPYPEEGGTKT